MIERYSRTQMTNIWTDESKYRLWQRIEIVVLEEMAALGEIPSHVPGLVKERSAFTIEEIAEIEERVKHDMIAFLTNLGDGVGEDARFIHRGLTSSDVYDTCFALQLSQATDLILSDIDDLLGAIKKRAEESKYYSVVGRTHGIHAEVTTFGLKLAQCYAEFKRHKERLISARAEIATCAISGAVGTFANVSPELEQRVANRLELAPETISTQVIPRDRHAMYFANSGRHCVFHRACCHRDSPSTANRSTRS